MNELEQQLVKLAEQQESLKDQLRQNAEEIEKALLALGVDYHFQADDGAVYKVVIPKGSYQYFKHIDYKRTNRPGERATDALSKTEAKSLGYDIL